MLPTQRHTGRCIYCAFRSQQQALQARRLRSTATNPNHVVKHFRSNRYPDPKISFTGRPEQDVDRRWQRGAHRPLESVKLTDGGGAKRLVNAGIKSFGFDNARLGIPPNFMDALHRRMTELRDVLKDAPVLEHMSSEDSGGESERGDIFKRIWTKFSRDVLADINEDTAWLGKNNSEGPQNLRKDLKEAFRIRGVHGLDERIKYAFYAQVTGSRFTQSDIKNQQDLADLRYPAEWFPATRAIHRTVHLHVGPTNSGKTYHALQRLEKAERGVYAGPLRLLAHEVYTRMNAKGRPCSLITGEERRAGTGDANGLDSALSACTVEMMPLNKALDVAVIDEIQMIGNNERGWAWTQALMGVKAKEVHLCGEERTVPLIRELCASVGDKLEIHKYERLSPLKVAETSLEGDLRRLRKGDCIVSFSVIGIHALRKQIEQQTGKKVATVYGSLPPETRAQQARLFNDPDNDYDYLVASDAVGMGLNLAIRRIIFETSSKFDGVSRRTLGVADIKQIAGRAGRYRAAAFNATAPVKNQDLAAAKGDSPVEVHPTTSEKEDKNENVGIVTTIEPFDFPVVAAAMTADPEPIKTAGIFPPSSVLERFASYFPPGTPFSYILVRLHELSQMHSRFHLCGLKEQIWVADLIEPVKGLTVNDRNVICSAPASKSDDMWKKLMPAYARCIAEQQGGSIVDIEELPLEILETKPSASREYLRELERLHKGIVTYLWLSYRFAGIFSTRALAFHVKGMVEERIEDVLGKFSFSETQRRKVAAKREQQILMEMKRTSLLKEATESDSENVGAGKFVGAFGSSQGAEQDPDSSPMSTLEEPEEQGSLLAGGDHFAGAEDLELGDLAEEELIVEDKAAASSFAAWRGEQTRGESQGTSESEEGAPMVAAQTEGAQTAAQEAITSDSLEAIGEERPSIAAILDEAGPETTTIPTTEKIAADPELAITPPFTSETELPTGQRPAVLESQNSLAGSC
ncbi:hypothetical protein LTR62_005878 [Meristemomyces frigidus]|uniref:RNA helicase n=1 Tax=Meristemomyces frigidus TaxID=1508187 RepID=A0AAN7YTE7_9PEZI|nr:hypothetical protein LTR62_005878 [Meristemomyces frigidus]